MGYYRELDGCGRFMKYSLFVVNFIIFIGGVTLTGLTIVALSEKIQHISELADTSLLNGSVYILLVGGIVVSIVSFFGCVGAAKEIRCFLFMYFIIIFLLLVIVLIGGILGYMYREKFVNSLQNQMHNSISHYRENKKISAAWDVVQSTFHCCGVNGYQDWPNDDIPRSCCETSNGKQMSCDQANAYTSGCIEKIQTLLQKHASLLGNAGIIVAILMVIGMIFSCALSKMV